MNSELSLPVVSFWSPRGKNIGMAHVKIQSFPLFSWRRREAGIIFSLKIDLAYRFDPRYALAEEFVFTEFGDPEEKVVVLQEPSKHPGNWTEKHEQ